MLTRRSVVSAVVLSLAVGAGLLSATTSGAGAAGKAPQVKVILLAETTGERTALRMRNFAVASELDPAERRQFVAP